MVTINIYGLDQFVVGELSARISRDIAKIYEIDEDDVHFISSNNMVFHNGNEQTSWRVFVEVNAPKKVEVLQDQMKLPFTLKSFLNIIPVIIIINTSIMITHFSSRIRTLLILMKLIPKIWKKEKGKTKFLPAISLLG